MPSTTADDSSLPSPKTALPRAALIVFFASLLLGSFPHTQGTPCEENWKGNVDGHGCIASPRVLTEPASIHNVSFEYGGKTALVFNDGGAVRQSTFIGNHCDNVSASFGGGVFFRLYTNNSRNATVARCFFL